MKKIIPLILIFAFMVSYINPVLGIEDVESNNLSINTKNKSEKILPAKNKFDYVNMEWWKGFNDSVLDEYIIKAVENNKDLKVATLNIDEYYQKIVKQRAGEMPSLSGGFAPAYAKLGKDESASFAIPLIASYELDLFGKNHNKTTAQRKMYEASILDERAAYIAIASAVGSSYVNIVRLDAMIDMQEEIVKLRKEIYEMMVISNAEGIASTSDLVKANSSYILGVTDLTELKKQRTQLLNAMAVLIGDSPNNIEEYSRTDWKTLTYSGNIPQTVSSEIIMQRPDYLRAERMLEKAGIDVKVARKECLPSLTLGGAYFFNSPEFGSLLTTSNAIWGLGGGILGTIFAGGSIKANLKIKKIAYEKSLKNYEKTNLTSIQEVNDSLVSVNMDREKLSKQKEIQKLEQKDFKLNSLKYDEGVISKLDLNQRKENLLNVDKMVYSSQFDCLIDYIGFYKAVGAKV
ncbi:MAG: TolC family protein [bacterium]|nr:TolC family protein [bacterium]